MLAATRPRACTAAASGSRPGKCTGRGHSKISRNGGELCYMWCMAQEPVTLPQAIGALRESLEAALEKGQGKQLQFGLGDIELTLKLAAVRDGQGRITWSVLGPDAGDPPEQPHTAKLTLRPRPTPGHGDPAAPEL